MTREDEHSDIAAPSPSTPGASSPGPSGEPEARLLPSDLRVGVDPGVEQLVGSTSPVVLLGGSPLKLLRLNPPADAIFGALARGRTLREAAHESGRSVRSVARFTRKLLDGGFVHPQWPPSEGESGSGLGAPKSGVSATKPDATIVVPAYQRNTELDRLLTSITATLGDTVAVVVVDDGSTDATGDVAKRHGAQVIRHESPRGPAAARNAGLATVTSEFVVFLDSDCVVSGDWLAPLMSHFRDPTVALVAPRIGGLEVSPEHRAEKPEQPEKPEHPNALRAYEHVRSSLDLGPQEAPVVPRTRVAYVPAAAMVARTAVMKAVGGFSTSMHVGEDVDLVWRLHEAGHGCRYEPMSLVHHDHRTTPAAFLKRRFQYGTSAAELAKRHPGQVPPLAVSGWSALAWGLLATWHPAGVVAGAAVAGGSTAALPRKLTSVADPNRLAARLALRGHLGAGRQLGSALWRSYLPLALIGSLISKRIRLTVIAAAVIPNLLEWKERRPALDPIRYVGIRLADDAAYCAGVWQGCVDAGSLAALKPDLTSWPGRRTSSTDPIGSEAKTSER